MQELVITCFVAVLLSMVVKLVFWFQRRDKQPKQFVKSFFRYYSVYDLHDVTSKSAITFCKVSNIFNIIFWLAIAILLTIGFINLPTTD